MKNLLMLFGAVLLIASCQKEEWNNETSNVVFVNKEFTPKDLDETKELIYNFVNTLGHGQINSRTNYPNTEVNEGKYVLEGAGNYLKNANLNSGNDSEAMEYTLSIDNIVENSSLKMVGSDMTNKFNQLLDEIIIEENNSEKTASAMDIIINDADNTATSITVKVLYDHEKVLVDPISWELAYILITLENQNLDYGNGCITYPSMVIFNNPTVFATTYCTENTDPNSITGCFYKEFIDPTTPDDEIPLYNSLEEDAAVSLEIANEIMDDFLNISDGQSTWPNYSVIKSVVKFRKQLYFQDEPFNNTIDDIDYTIYTHQVRLVAIGGVGDCF